MRRAATGVMIEGLAQPWSGHYVSPGDRVLQMNRVLGLTGIGHVLIAQSCPDAGDVHARMFVTGSFLLVRGDSSFLNLGTGFAPAWFPEHDLPTGAPLDALPADISTFRQGHVHVRRFAGGTVVANPGD